MLHLSDPADINTMFCANSRVLRSQSSPTSEVGRFSGSRNRRLPGLPVLCFRQMQSVVTESEFVGPACPLVAELAGRLQLPGSCWPGHFHQPNIGELRRCARSCNASVLTVITSIYGTLIAHGYISVYCEVYCKDPIPYQLLHQHATKAPSIPPREAREFKQLHRQLITSIPK